APACFQSGSDKDRTQAATNQKAEVTLFFGLVLWESDLDEDVAVFDFQRIDSELYIPIMCGLPGFRIPGPRMPRADDLAIFDHALSERAAAVQACVVHGREGAIDVGNADFFIAALKFLSFIRGGQFGLSGEFDE